MVPLTDVVVNMGFSVGSMAGLEQSQYHVRVERITGLVRKLSSPLKYGVADDQDYFSSQVLLWFPFFEQGHRFTELSKASRCRLTPTPGLRSNRGVYMASVPRALFFDCE